jgi:hypothetical protein
MRAPLLLVLLSLLAAVVPAWSADEPEPPSAELHLVSSTSGVAARSWVAKYATETCEKGERLASFNLVTRGEKKVQVPIGERIYLLAVANVEPPVGADTVGKTTCRGMGSFVPEDGKVYEVRHDLKARNCPLLVTEGGKEVATYQKHKAKGPCKDAD